MEVVTGATRSLIPKLGALLQEEYHLQDKVKKDIESLQNELIFMNAALRTVAEVPEDELGEEVKTWAIIIRELSYDMEDAVNAFLGQVVHGHQDPAGMSCFMGLITKSFNMLLMGKTNHRIAEMIQEIKDLTSEVAMLRQRYSLGWYGAPNNPTPIKKKKSNLLGGGGDTAGYPAAVAQHHQESTRRLIGIQQPVGVENMPELEKWIVSDEDKMLRVLSIVGFGGVGKTTTALALHKRCGVHFERRAMVTVSNNTDPDVVLCDILRQVKPQEGENGTTSISAKKNPRGRRRWRWPSNNQEGDGGVNKVLHELREHLGKNRYLVLIDDVWWSSTWQTILKCLPPNDKGSRIIVTTRFEAVAMTSFVDHHKCHKMAILSAENAKDLFVRSLSECCWSNNARQSQAYQVPARVWEMCGGLPLPIVSMAGLVASKPQMIPEEWSVVCESLFPRQQVCHKPEDFMRIINFCYNDLPDDLKTCSLYLSIFPKGWHISRKRLTRHWISEGFLTARQGLSVEDVAEMSFCQLITRRIILPVQHSSDGQVKMCRVHDMFLEYITSKADQENFVTVVGSYWSTPATRSSKVRRLSLHCSSSGSIYAKREDGIINTSHVRSLAVFGNLHQQITINLLKTGIVQVLDLQGCKGFKKSHVKAIFEMILLRYLGLRGTDITSLASNLGNLRYLETLDVRDTDIQELPRSVGHLERIANILGGNKRTRQALKLPREINRGAMKTLRVLSGVEIAEGSSAATNLHVFTGLRKLSIYKVAHIDGLFHDLRSSIQYLGGYNLRTLVIHDDSAYFLDTLDSMSWHPTDLSALELSGKLLKLPNWLPFLGKLTKLTLSATALCTDNLLLLSKIGSLFSLSFSSTSLGVTVIFAHRPGSEGEIFVPGVGFGKLQLLRIFAPHVPALHFSTKGTPLLQRLELRFERFEGVYGIDKLGSLQDVILTFDQKIGEPTKSILEELKKSSATSQYALSVCQ